MPVVIVVVAVAVVAIAVVVARVVVRGRCIIRRRHRAIIRARRVVRGRRAHRVEVVADDVIITAPRLVFLHACVEIKFRAPRRRRNAVSVAA